LHSPRIKLVESCRFPTTYVTHWWQSIGPAQTQIDNPDDLVVAAFGVTDFGVTDDMYSCESSC